MWYGKADVIGDPTGGNSTLTLQFGLAGEQRDSQLYSVQQVSAFLGVSGVGKNCQFQTLNMGLNPTQVDSGLDWVWDGFLQLGSAVALPLAALIPRDNPTPFFAGVQDTLIQNYGFRAVVSNTDNEVFGLVALGYVWDARARSFPGGPKVPVDSLLGATG